MKVLLDACVWGGALPEVAGAGHDAIWAGDWPSDPGDEAILARALDETRTLVTLDKDFGELAVLRRQRHCGIVRLVGFAARRQGAVCVDVLARYGEDLAGGAVITVEPGRVRVRPGDFDA